MNTGGVTNATFGMALHEIPIMVPVAFVLEFFVVEKLATALAFTFIEEELGDSAVYPGMAAFNVKR